jgi:hypothetical protein
MADSRHAGHDLTNVGVQSAAPFLVRPKALLAVMTADEMIE